PLLRVELRNLVRAREEAVLAADALIIEVPNDPGDRILLVRLHRATVHARGIHAVVAGRRHGLLHRRAGSAAVNHADRAPRLAGIEAVQAVTCCDAGFTGGAAVEIDAEGVLL